MTSEYAVYSALGLWLLRELWPFVKDRLYPDLAAERKAILSRNREREDRVFEAFQANTTAIVELKTTMSTINDQQREMVVAVRELNEDVAGLYGHLQKPRPSRRKEPSNAAS